MVGQTQNVKLTKFGKKKKKLIIKSISKDSMLKL